jgi:hypothetical protein
MGPMYPFHKSYDVPILGHFVIFASCFYFIFFDKLNQHLNVVRKGGKHTLNFWFNIVQHQMQEKHKFKLNKQLLRNPRMQN